jgi:N-acetylglucosamine repressor
MRKINTRNFKRATRTTARQVNRQILLNLVREHQPISRADLARRMNLGRGMVTELVNTLIEEGVIYEGVTAAAPRGRRPTLLHIRTRDRFVVGVDVRFSRTYIMLCDFSGHEIALETFETKFAPGELVSALSDRIRRVLKAHRASRNCEGIGLVVPGMVDRLSGRVLNAPQLGWRDVDVRTALSQATGLPVIIENAPNACALAHLWLGSRAREDHDNFVYVTVSDGVGAGLVVNGQVVRGHGNTAGEFGHVPITLDGPRCLCGALGCLEAYTSNLATLARYLGVDLSQPDGVGRLQESTFTIDDLIARARSGDARAIRALEETGRYLGVGLSVIVNGLNPARVFVGGEIAQAWDFVEAVVRSGVAERALTEAAANTPIVPEPGTEHPRLRGATALMVAPQFAAPQVA